MKLVSTLTDEDVRPLALAALKNEDRETDTKTLALLVTRMYFDKPKDYIERFRRVPTERVRKVMVQAEREGLVYRNPYRLRGGIGWMHADTWARVEREREERNAMFAREREEMNAMVVRFAEAGFPLDVWGGPQVTLKKDVAVRMLDELLELRERDGA